MQAVELPSFPANENPFWHDSVSCGSDLLQATMNVKLSEVYVMSNTFMGDTYDFYIVNRHDGSRIGIKL